MKWASGNRLHAEGCVRAGRLCSLRGHVRERRASLPLATDNWRLLAGEQRRQLQQVALLLHCRMPTAGWWYLHLAEATELEIFTVTSAPPNCCVCCFALAPGLRPLRTGCARSAARAPGKEVWQHSVPRGTDADRQGHEPAKSANANAAEMPFGSWRAVAWLHARPAQDPRWTTRPSWDTVDFRGLTTPT